MDVTLRRGDVVMTERGLVLFNGEPHRSPSQIDLIPLARASGLARESRATLFAMEYAVGPYGDNQNAGATSESLSSALTKCLGGVALIGRGDRRPSALARQLPV
jgi:hypothetical protein